MKIDLLYDNFLKSKGIIIDSRKVIKDCIFVALKGENFDGHDFIIDSINKDAMYAISEKEIHGYENKIIKVNDTLETLQKLANYHRKISKVKIFALTGSNGKTTTKELINCVLNSKYKVKATEGNLNNHIGVPLTLLGFHPDTDIGIVEMGANHRGEISQLCKIAEPDFGLITNIGKAHLEGFGNIEGIARAKGELFNYLKERGGTIFVNEKNELLNKILPENYKNLIFYNNNDISGRVINSFDYFIKVELFIYGKKYLVNTQLVGAYNLENILAAVAVGKYFKISDEDICKMIESYKPENYRSQFIKTSSNKVIMDAYNANPSSMEQAIKNFAELSEKNKVLVLGSMYELGKFEKEEHEKIIDLVKNYDFQKIYMIGLPFCKVYKESDNLKYFENIEDFLKFVQKNQLKNSCILIKGSRKNKLEKLLDYL